MRVRRRRRVYGVHRRLSEWFEDYVRFYSNTKRLSPRRDKQTRDLFIKTLRYVYGKGLRVRELRRANECERTVAESLCAETNCNRKNKYQSKNNK